ncbi:MAG: hypothetical protein ACI81Y_002454 [Glaciecola sp.]|jgi:hypothetical protein
MIMLLFVTALSCDSGGSKNVTLETAVSTKMFTKVESSHSKINFRNRIKENRKFNFLSYMYVYNGGGVSTGDINNDGLIDIYFTSNQNENKLYLNKGNFVFEDITKKANVSDSNGWSTGVTMVDINCDGWMDMYVCKSASLNNNKERKNKLFINQKDNTFKEEASKWKIDDMGFSTQSYFFDMDKDGDLDMYLVNHRADFQNNGQLNLILQKQIINEYSDQLYRNDNTHFTNITLQAGILNKSWGLSASIGDFNNDNWPDIYVCNDYLEPDNLYINQKDNTFKDELLSTMNHISFNSMGSDFGDINNDGHNDLVVLDMTPSDHVRSKTNMASMSTENFNSVVDAGYHHQYMLNMLQLNNGNGTYSEIGQMAKISKSDWSWAPLLADFDNDGHKDLFVSTGILKDLGNRDFRNEIKAITRQGQKITLDSILMMIPNEKLSNRLYQNSGDYTFKDKSNDWGLDQPSFSNGSSYADLDNDGDLDLITNNINDQAFLFENNTRKNFLQVSLKGSENNPSGIGASVCLYSENGKQTQDMFLSRGFQSSVQNRINFGLGNLSHIDSLVVTWPNDQVNHIIAPAINTFLVVDKKDATSSRLNPSIEPIQSIQSIDPQSLGIDFVHQENIFDDYQNQVLLPHSQSRNGPFIEKADVNNDGLDDFYIGGAAGQAGVLYVQSVSGTFNRIAQPFIKDRNYEDLGLTFFDFDNDMDMDLYIVSGGSEFPEGSPMFQDRLYKNDGKGNFTKTKNVLPEITQSGQVVIHADIDNDGDDDVFIGGRIIPDKYPYTPASFLLMNDNGKFTKKGLDQNGIGMVTGATFSDYDSDGDQDLFIVGEWSQINILNNDGGKFSKTEIPVLENSIGIWQSIVARDIDNDGDDDYFVGNMGKNVKFDTENGKEFHVFCDDFDENGTYDVILSNKYNGNLVPIRGRECSAEQLPNIELKFPNYQEFANATLEDILNADKFKNALHYKANTLYHLFIENEGNGFFKMTELPMACQIAPAIGWAFKDMDNDGMDEVFLVGNNYNTEVETIRLDASFGAILQYDSGDFNSIKALNSGFSTRGDCRSIKIINDDIILVSVNNSVINCFKAHN